MATSSWETVKQVKLELLKSTRMPCIIKDTYKTHPRKQRVDTQNRHDFERRYILKTIILVSMLDFGGLYNLNICLSR